MNKILINALLSLVYLCLPMLAQAQTTFGAEFTLTSRELISAPRLYPQTDDDISTKYGQELLTKLSSKIKDMCSSCKVTTTRDRYDLPIYKVELPHGFSFLVTLDPAVVEFVPQAETIEGFKLNEQLLQKLIFDVSQDLGLMAHASYGGGHVHIGLDSAFKGDPVLFRNFFVDWLNHSDFMKHFTGSSYNSPTFFDLPFNPESKMREILSQFDQILQKEGFTKNPTKNSERGNELILWFAQQVEEKIYHRTAISHWTPPEKYQALNMTRITNHKTPREQKTIELRFFAAQKSVQEFIVLTDLLNQRINYLSNQKTLIEYKKMQEYSIEETHERMKIYASELKTRHEAFLAYIQNLNLKLQIKKTSRLCDYIFTI